MVGNRVNVGEIKELWMVLCVASGSKDSTHHHLELRIHVDVSPIWDFLNIWIISSQVTELNMFYLNYKTDVVSRSQNENKTSQTFLPHLPIQMTNLCMHGLIHLHQSLRWSADPHQLEELWDIDSLSAWTLCMVMVRL